MKQTTAILAILCLLLLPACQTDEPPSQPDRQDVPSAFQHLQLDQSNDSGVRHVTTTIDLLPEPLTSADPIKAVLHNCAEQAEFQWSVNSRLLGLETSESLANKFYRRGDTISLTANCGNITLKTEAVVQNSPPSITAVRFADPALAAGKALTVIPEANDEDGDLIEYRYEWEIDGLYQDDLDGPTLPGERLKKETTVVLAVTPYDGIEDGATFQGLSLVIPNSTPIITSQPPALTTAQYRYQVMASDPDNDNLSYKLNQRPEGMTIDPVSGLLSWTVTQNTPRETYEIEISVEDEDGAQARQSFSLSLANGGQ